MRIAIRCVNRTVVGGLAVAFWRHPRLTRDVDILVNVEADSPEHVLSVLQQHGFRPRHEPPIRKVGDFRLLQLLYAPTDACVDVQVDVILAETVHARMTVQQSTIAELPSLGCQVRMPRCEDLILLKLASGRVLDFADASALLRVHRRNLDLAYLDEWAGKLDLKDDWNRLQHEIDSPEPPATN